MTEATGTRGWAPVNEPARCFLPGCGLHAVGVQFQQFGDQMVFAVEAFGSGLPLTRSTQAAALPGPD